VSLTLAACKEKQEVQDKGDWAEEKRRMVEWQEAQQHKYLNEIADLKTVFYNEIKVWNHMYISIKFLITVAVILRQSR
jgi:hypothetical protein